MGAVVAMGALGASVSSADDSSGNAPLAPLVVTATRVATPSFDVLAAIDVVDRPLIQSGQLEVNLSEPLLFVPGVSAQNRQNYAQDVQLSIRGFGARSSFGVRGVRLYADGIPGTMPDGQGQFSQFDLSSAGRMEILRGPFSALYGNASGGVIALFTEDPPPGRELDGSAEYGTFDTQRYALKTMGNAGALRYVLDVAHFQTDGYRVHSHAERNNFNAVSKLELSSASLLTVVANAIATPFIADPLGLNQAQLAADPHQAGTGALLYDTRKSLEQQQLGVIERTRFSAADEISTTLYLGHRATTQFQAIPKFTEKSPLNPGGVIDLDRAFYGIDSHETDVRTLLGGPLQLVTGIAYDDLQETRHQYLNFADGELGVEGLERLAEANHVYDFDQYVQGQWDPQERWRLTAGMRHSEVDVASHGLLSGDGRSGVRYSAVNPIAGLLYRATSAVHVYASYGRGFETPTLNDLQYRSIDGSLPGLNTGLKAARSDNYELGVKTQGPVRATLDGFYIKTHDELAVQSNFNGRTVQENIGETSRRGAELGLDADLPVNLSTRIAYTYLRARVAQNYESCVGVPCVPAVVTAGRQLPAVPSNALYAGLTWRASPLSATLETQARAHVYADDRSTAFAGGYWQTNVRVGLDQSSARWTWHEFLRVDNVTNRSYVGSVIVNESNRRFFEPAPGRTAYLMFNASWRLD
jgi:iron complex outermembrane receptor protein